MPKSKVIMALAKVMIAAAWVDGEVTAEEINSFKDLLFQLPDMTASDWAELEIYIDAPVGEAERDRLVEELRAAISNPSDKAQAMAALDEVVSADGEVSDAERAVVAEVKGDIENADVGIFGQMSRMMRGPVSRRSKAVANAPNRELEMDDFVKNRIFFQLRRRLELDDAEIDIPESVQRKLSLAGGLMARVAYVDREIDDGEFDAMVANLQKNWGVSELEADLVAEVALSEIGKNLDYYRLSRGFFESTTEVERIQFLDVLFAIADGDGRVSFDETEEIRTIAAVLKLTHKQFIDAKLKIPGDRRSS
ncbi:MAG: TerB family tellurite resistance protein [Anaerolineales bacterium]|jgi:uncharacterized tellurite resistance protein B-like protein